MPGDLHTHTTFSDGSTPADKLPFLAACAGMTHLAISDHDSIQSVRYAYAHPVQNGVHLIPATELTAYDYERAHRVHLLCYWPDDCAALADFSAMMAERRLTAMLQSCKELEATCPQFRTEEALELAKDSGTLFKAQVMRVLWQYGLADGMYNTVYKSLFGLKPVRGRILHTPRYEPVDTVLDVIKASRAVVVLALGFFLVGIAKGSVINTCTILVSDNSADRTRGMNLMHSCYACGALLCPFFIAAAGRVSGSFAVLVLAVLGLLLWLVYMGTPFAGKGAGKKEVTDWSFLKSTRFWLLTGLLFCQNAAEQSVTGWMVTYFKGSGIIAGALAAYTVTVMWGATLVARLLIAFVFPFKQPRKAMVVMGVSCTIFYILLVQARSQGAAIVLLFAFAFAMAGMNPTAVASAGKMTSVTSMGIMLPAASSGAILMPWVIGRVAERAGLAAGMAMNIVPCVGLIIFSVLVERLSEQEYEKS